LFLQQYEFSVGSSVVLITTVFKYFTYADVFLFAITLGNDGGLPLFYGW